MTDKIKKDPLAQKLAQKKCIPCEKGGTPLLREQINELLKEVNGWNLITKHAAAKDGSGKGVVFLIEKNFQFLDFKHALGFVNEIGDIAEHEGHHPDMSIHDWNKLTITLWTHSMKGLSENDFIMAAKIDQTLIESSE